MLIGNLQQFVTLSNFLGNSAVSIFIRGVLLTSTLILLQSCQRATDLDIRLDEAANSNSQLGLAYLHAGDRSHAKQKLLLALQEAPNSPVTNSAMAFFMEQVGDISTAQKYYRRALALDPQNGAQLNNYGVFLCRIGKYIEAEQYFLRAERDSQYVQTAAVFENAGLCATSIHDYRSAKNYFKQALKQDPSRTKSLYELIHINMLEGNLTNAMNYLTKYSVISLKDCALLRLGYKVAHKVKNFKLEADFMRESSKCSNKPGVKYEYNSSNGW